MLLPCQPSDPGQHNRTCKPAGRTVGSGDPALFVYIATFAIKQGPAHKNIKVEVPCTGTPQGDKAAAWAEIRRQFPTAPKNSIVRTSEKISPRAGSGAQAVQFSEGMTVRQLFPDRTEFEAARLVGRISFDSEPHDVILRHIRAKSVQPHVETAEGAGHDQGFRTGQRHASRV